MSSSLSHFRWREALPRLLADFTIVQLSFIVSLAVSSSLRLRSQPEMSGVELAAMFENLYFHVFLPLSSTKQDDLFEAGKNITYCCPGHRSR